MITYPSGRINAAVGAEIIPSRKLTPGHKATGLPVRADS